MRGGWAELAAARRLADAVGSAAELALLRAGVELGLLEALRRPADPVELAQRLGLAEDLVAGWARLLAARGWLVREHGRFRRSRRAERLFGSDRARPSAGLLELAHAAWLPALSSFAEVVKGGARPGLEGSRAWPALAEIARAVEGPALGALLRIPGARRVRRILEVGSGAGLLLAGLLERYRDAQGLAIEADAELAERTRRELAEHGLARRGEVHTGDFLTSRLPPGRFDLGLLPFSLIRFPPSERGALLRKLAARLAEGGLVAILLWRQPPEPLASFGGASLVACLDLFVALHADLHPQPDDDELRAQLEACGFEAGGEIGVLAGGLVRYVWARRRPPG